MNEYQEYLASEAREIRRYRIVLIVMWVACLFTMCAFVFGMRAEAHEATNVQGFPLGWDYDAGCCRSALQPMGDCAPIASEYVTEREDGYHINIPVGGHPKLLTKGYSGVVPYGVERRSPEGNYHICLSTDGAHRFCFYAGAKGF